MGGTLDSSSAFNGGWALAVEVFAEEFALLVFLGAFCFVALSEAPVFAWKKTDIYEKMNDKKKHDCKY